ncbi:SMU1112c/YaeR family gloxylase I-like metalloprotein [Sphingobacterium sp. MYb382]|uniref:SMU1112c/YaeR family gloxylase I-like metalloprotein n=1 Tax=Sphingobacterium sp. MYb382 TaxID=2745278 RepID=UPI00309A2CA0
MIQINKVHHIAIICSDYKRSLQYYTEILGFKLDQETYREARDSYKADLSLHGAYIIELFSFPSPPSRPSRPEAQGLRHLAFEIDDVSAVAKFLQAKELPCEDIRIDELTGKRFLFTQDPDALPIEFYEK